MSAYTAPVKDMRLALDQVAGLDEICALPGFEEITPDIIDAVLEEGAKLAANVWAPLNPAGDKKGAAISDGVVTTTPGFKDAYQQFVQGGWNAVPFDPAYGGQGLPWALSMALGEMWQSANLSLSLCPLLTQAAIEAVHLLGTADQKNTYLPKMISGEWTGTMNLTEPQAGTDLAAIKTVAKKHGDHYLMKGQKIFITFGEHDFTPNIIHLVLARIDGLPEGNEGLGLFIVPKFLVSADGGIGARNDLKAVSLEHKLGIHGSPTCVMAYGEKEGAIAYLLGNAGEGLKNMFIMMNNARISVGLQGVAVAERAYQHALAYAKDRTQGFRLGEKGGKRVPIIEHADVRRMLLTMKAMTEAGRAMAYYAGGMIDRAHHVKDEAARQKAQLRVDLMTPLVKSWCTDMSVEVASLGVQIHGGMGFIEETGAAQFYRDARILPIYEGTNGIQAADLVFRKLLRDKGAAVAELMAEIKVTVDGFKGKPSDHLDAIGGHIGEALPEIEKTTRWMLENAKSNTDALAAASTLYLRQLATLTAAWLIGRQALAAQDETKNLTARFFAENILPQISGLSSPIMGGFSAVGLIANDRF